MSEEKKPVTVEELDLLVELMFAQKRKIEEADAVTTELNKELTVMKGKAVAYLKELGRDSYRTEFGTIGIGEKWRVSIPQTDDDKQALFGHLKERGILWQYATVNSNSLNSLFLQDWEIAKKAGDGMGFKMPGVSDPKLFEDLRMTKR
jgi:hypothetical protein